MDSWKDLRKNGMKNFQRKANYIAKGLRNNASTCKKKRKGSRDLRNATEIIEEPHIIGKIKWDNAKKLVQLKEQSGNGGVRFMERLKKHGINATQNLGI